MSNYSELLKDPRWQKKRLLVFERDNWTCQSCLDTESTLHVHHTKYIGEFPWECPDEYLMTLCEKCHEEEEFNKDIDVYESLSDLGITRRHLGILIDHVRYRMLHPTNDENAMYRPFWMFHYCILRELVPNDELSKYIEYLENKKQRIQGSAKIAQPDHEQSEVEKQSSSS
jgi:hypothetical protein